MTVWQNGLTKVAALLTALCALPAARGAALGCAEHVNAAYALSATGRLAKTDQGLVPGALPLPGVFANAPARALPVAGCSCSCAAGRMSRALLVRLCQHALAGAQNLQPVSSRTPRLNYREKSPPNVLSLSRHVPPRADHADTRTNEARAAEAAGQRTARGRLL